MEYFLTTSEEGYIKKIYTSNNRKKEVDSLSIDKESYDRLIELQNITRCRYIEGKIIEETKEQKEERETLQKTRIEKNKQLKKEGNLKELLIMLEGYVTLTTEGTKLIG